MVLDRDCCSRCALRRASTVSQQGFHHNCCPFAGVGRDGGHGDVQRDLRCGARTVPLQRRRQSGEHRCAGSGAAEFPLRLHCRRIRRTRRPCHIFEGVAASTISDVLWIRNGEPLRLRGNHISHNGFDVMGVPALHGRTVTTQEEEPETKAVLGYGFFNRQFGGDVSVLGRTLVLNGRPRTIVGVMPPRFMFRGADVYLPIHYRGGEAPEGVTGVSVTARRKAGVTSARAQTDLDPVIRDLAQRYPARYPQKWTIELLTFKETFPSSIRKTLWIMFAAVGLLLLIACANVSNLLLARALTRQREMAVRPALGASRARIVRQLLTESLLLAMIGGAIGVPGSWLGLKAIMSIVPADVIPAESEVVLNLPVLMFSFGICLAATLIFGFAPALHSTRGDLAGALKESARGSGGSRSMGWLRGSLVVVELSLAVILLAGAGLKLHTMAMVHDAPLGAAIENRLTMRFPLNSQRYPTAESRSAFISQLAENLKGVPGVKAVGVNAGLHPFGSWGLPVEIRGAAGQQAAVVSLHQVNAEYWLATGIALRQGRLFSGDEVAGRRRLAVVNEAFAKRYFAGMSPLGKIVSVPRMKGAPFVVADPQFEIVGVVADAIHEFHNREARTEMYIPYSLTGLAEMLIVHTEGEPMRFAPAVRAEVYRLDGSQFVDETYSLAALMERWVYSSVRFDVWLIGVFAALGLVLAVIGVYGLLQQTVAAERREYGVRMAIGANTGDIVRLVMWRGAKLMGTGLTIGITVTLGLLWYFGVHLGVSDPLEPVSLGGSCAVLLVAGFAACMLPALRAGRTNPVDVLRLD
ncbi:MAG: ABC transporter permease [Bryobacterales bacterium]|nr:ABC transporter permease [Bryobacterales bacterium]